MRNMYTDAINDLIETVRHNNRIFDVTRQLTTTSLFFMIAVVICSVIRLISGDILIVRIAQGFCAGTAAYIYLLIAYYSAGFKFSLADSDHYKIKTVLLDIFIILLCLVNLYLA